MSSGCLTCHHARVGFSRHDKEKPSSLDQLDDDYDGCNRTALINFCSRFAAAGPAPFGILFRICRRGGWTSTSFCGGDEAGIDAVVLTSRSDDAVAAGSSFELEAAAWNGRTWFDYDATICWELEADRTRRMDKMDCWLHGVWNWQLIWARARIIPWTLSMNFTVLHMHLTTGKTNAAHSTFLIGLLW